jgi:sarcosine oxidase
MVGRDEQAEVLPILEPPEDEALLDELGGAIDVRAAIDGLAGSLGERLVAARVFGVREAGSGVELHTSEGLWSAERAILCPGAELHELTANLGVDIPLTIDLHTRASFPVREPGARLACLQDRSGVHGETVYAAPMPDGLQYAIGLGGELEPPVDEALTRLRGYVERAMPGLEPAPDSVRLCQTSILPWGADAFAVWASERVAVLAGANLFKFGPLLGELLAEGSVDDLSPAAQLGRGVSEVAGRARTSG